MIIDLIYRVSCDQGLIQVDVVSGTMRSIDETFISDNISVANSSKIGVGYSAFRNEKAKVQNSSKVIQKYYFFSYEGYLRVNAESNLITIL